MRAACACSHIGSSPRYDIYVMKGGVIYTVSNIRDSGNDDEDDEEEK